MDTFWSSAVEQMELVDGVMLATGSADGTTRLWSLLGDTLEEQEQEEEQEQQLAEGKFAFSKKGSREQRQGAYVILADGDMLVIHKAAGACREPVACFRAPGTIDVLACAGDEVAVGCESGELLLLRGAFLLAE
jgi:hypothetical protein